MAAYQKVHQSTIYILIQTPPTSPIRRLTLSFDFAEQVLSWRSSALQHVWHLTVEPRDAANVLVHRWTPQRGTSHQSVNSANGEKPCCGAWLSPILQTSCVSLNSEHRLTAIRTYTTGEPLMT